jgi:hypothetical protein
MTKSIAWGVSFGGAWGYSFGQPPVEAWDTAQGKAPSNQFIALRQTTIQAKKAGAELKTAKVLVKTTAFVYADAILRATTNKVTATSARASVHISTATKAKTYSVQSGIRKVKVYQSSIYKAKSNYAQTSYARPSVSTSSTAFVRVQDNSVRLAYYKPQTKTIQNPTDAELYAIMLMMKQQKLKQAAKFRKMM